MTNGVMQAAQGLPAPLFVAVVAGLVFLSTGGVPVPISAALLVAGAVATRMEHGALVWLALLVASTATLSARDLGVMWLSRQGANGIAKILATWRTVSPTAEAPATAGRQPAPATWRTWLAARADITLGEVQILCQDLLTRGWVAIALTRLSPLATPLDIAAGMLRFSPLAFAGGIIPGRLVYVGLLLGAGAISGQALQSGNLLLITGALSTVLLLLLLLSRLVRRWVSHRQFALSRK